jgi:hypothetical protein
MESLAMTVVLILVLSILLAATALLFAWLFSKGKVSYRAAVVWVVVAAADVSFLVIATQMWRAYIVQLLLVLAAIAVLANARRSKP